MEQKTMSHNERIAALGVRLLGVLEKEDDPAVFLSAVALLAAVGCDSMARDDDANLDYVAEGFVQTFRGIMAKAKAVSVSKVH